VPSVIEGVVTEYRDAKNDDLEFGLIFDEELRKKTAKLSTRSTSAVLNPSR